MVCQEILKPVILVDYKVKEVIMETIIFGYMTTTHLSACQIKQPKVAIVTKSTNTNIKKLKVYLSNETKPRLHTK